MAKEKVLVSFKELYACCRTAFEKAGLSPSDADTAAEVLTCADLQGISTHGSVRLMPYINRIRKNLINPNPDIKIESPADAIRIIEGDHGLGQVVAMAGLKEAIAVAKEKGICFTGCRNSHHMGAGAPYALKACRENMVMLGGTNAFPTMAPTNGKDIIVGNNPFFMGVPRKNPPHFILDIAMSTAARGKMRYAQQNNEKIPLGWALDKEGNPTTDPEEGLKGYVLPIGDHKGYGLALAMDILAGVLTGSGMGKDVLSLFQQWDKPQRVGHFFIVLNPARLMPMETFYERSEYLLNMIKGSTPWNQEKPVMLPGEFEAKKYDEQKEKGLLIARENWAELQKLAQGIVESEVAKY